MDAPNWDFKLAREFSKAFRSESEDTTSIPPQRHDRNVPHGLGDFARVFAFLRVDATSVGPLHITSANVRHESTDSASSLPSSYSTVASSEPAENFDEFISKAKGVRWNDEIAGENLTESRRRSAGISDIDAAAIVQLLHDDSETAAVPASSVDISKQGLNPLPLTLQKPAKSYKNRPPPIPWSYVDSTIIRPFYDLTAKEQKAKLIKKLIKRFPDPTSLLSTDPALAISNLKGVTNPKEGIHVFVDFSNIIIGFSNRLKAIRNIHEKAYVKQPPISYHSLALILERGRPVARRILVGSTTRYLPTHSSPQKPPRHFSEASMCGYELNILERVSKPQSSTPIWKMKNGTGNGYATATSGQESGSESATAFTELKRPVMAEQAVDEILQMKLLESLVDTAKPTTIVLASGDAAEAEYSGGFLKNVERALIKGWKVEIVAWHDGLSKDYHNKSFLGRWEGKIRIIELDEFCEELLAVYNSPVSGFA